MIYPVKASINIKDPSKPVFRHLGKNNNTETTISEIGKTHATAGATRENIGEAAICSLKTFRSDNLLNDVYRNKMINK